MSANPSTVETTFADNGSGHDSDAGSNNGPARRCGSRSRDRRGNWTPVNTVATVLGFVVFWPIGLFILFWVLSGRDVRALPGIARERWQAFNGRDGDGFGRGPRSGNRAFDDFQRAQYDRIREIKDEITARGRRFREFRADVRRRHDEEEFHRFMATAPERGDAA